MLTLQRYVGLLFLILFTGETLAATERLGASNLNGGGACPAAGNQIMLYGTLGQSIAGMSAGARAIHIAGFWTPWLGAVTTDNEPPKPSVFSLRQNFPNPFNPSTTIHYSVAERSKVVIAIFNVAGQRVKVLLDSEQEAGEKAVQWDGRDEHGRNVTSGIYFCEMRAGGFVAHRKMILLR